MNSYKNDNTPNNQANKIKMALEELADQIRIFYGARVETQVFSSEAMMIDIFCQDKLFVVAYSPSYGFGVDEVKEGDGFTTSYNFYTNEIDLVGQEIHRLIKQYKL
jgi:hypothetical protein